MRRFGRVCGARKATSRGFRWRTSRPEDAAYPLRFERALELDASVLTKVAPAVERAGIHLGVWPEGGELKVWGTTRALPALCFVLEVATPGLLVIKHHRGEELGKFLNVAVLEGDQHQSGGREGFQPAGLSGIADLAAWGSIRRLRGRIR